MRASQPVSPSRTIVDAHVHAYGCIKLSTTTDWTKFCNTSARGHHPVPCAHDVIFSPLVRTLALLQVQEYRAGSSTRGSASHVSGSRGAGGSERSSSAGVWTILYGGPEKLRMIFVQVGPGFEYGVIYNIVEDVVIFSNASGR